MLYYILVRTCAACRRPAQNDQITQYYKSTVPHIQYVNILGRACACFSEMNA